MAATHGVVKRKLHTARTFPARDLWTVGRAWVLLLAAEVGLRTLPFPVVAGAAAGGGRGAEEHTGAEAMAVIERLERLVDVAARNHVIAMSCLRRALVLQRLLGRRGIQAELRFGVRKEEGDLEAHAWLEHAGRPLSERGTVRTRFAPLAGQEAGR